MVLHENIGPEPYAASGTDSKRTENRWEMWDRKFSQTR
jgi:hypothetical protein